MYCLLKLILDSITMNSCKRNKKEVLQKCVKMFVWICETQIVYNILIVKNIPFQF